MSHSLTSRTSVTLFVGLIIAVVLHHSSLATARAQQPESQQSETTPPIPVEEQPVTEQPAAANAALFEADATAEQLAPRIFPSMVLITNVGRDGREQGLGSGFIISEEGLIATNLHVIGEARPISVSLHDGRRFSATAVHAYDRKADLAIIRIDAGKLPALPLGDSSTLRDGQPVIAVGNPRGLRNSVVSGIVSGTREIDGRRMIQLAIPIESGNSGGPLLDMRGRVHGLLTLKSVVTENLGFAVSINDLKPLLEKPNTVPMSRWLTIGALDARDWTIVGESAWRRRAGAIQVAGAGGGFGGRSQCLSTTTIDGDNVDVETDVKLDDESGAAGIAFSASGGDQHYGFYPSNGRLRLTRFDGADVFSWTVLEERGMPEYRRGEWNTIRVQATADRIVCYVNDVKCIESTDRQFRSGRVGLVKFRDTSASFRHFRAAAKLPSLLPSDDETRRVIELVSPFQTARPEPSVSAMTESLLPLAAVAPDVLRQQAADLEKQAARLRSLAGSVHERAVQTELVAELDRPEAEIDMLNAALLVAKLDNKDLDVPAYRKHFARLGEEARSAISSDATSTQRLQKLGEWMFTEQGFHGSRGDYYHRNNSYLNEVLDDREGIPLTLSILYMELAAAIGVRLEGVALPGHFVVRLPPEVAADAAAGDAAAGVAAPAAAVAGAEPADASITRLGQMIDVFESGALLTPAATRKLLLETLGTDTVAPAANRKPVVKPAGEQSAADAPKPATNSDVPRRTIVQLPVADKRAIIVRMLRNLSSLAQREQDAPGMLRYYETLLALTPDSAADRWYRAVLLYQLNRHAEAYNETAWLLDHRPEGIDLSSVAQLHELLQGILKMSESSAAPMPNSSR